MSNRSSFPSRRLLGLVVCLSLLVLCAGCVSVNDANSDDGIEDAETPLPEDTGEDSSPDSDSTTTEDSEQPSDSDTTEGSDNPDSGDGGSSDDDPTDESGESSTGGSDGSAGNGENGDTGIDGQLAETHTSAVTDAETLTTNVWANLDTQIGNVTFNSTTYIDFSASEARQVTVTEASTGNGLLSTTLAAVENYATAETVYKRTESDFSDEPEYNQTAVGNGAWEDETLTAFLQTDLIGNADENILWTQDGTETLDGTEVVRYVANSDSQFEGFQESATSTIDEQSEDESGDGTSFTLDDDTITITSMSATMLVSPDGVVREFTYTVAGTTGEEPVSLEIRLSVSDIDSTTVTAPDWVENSQRR